MYPPPSPTEIFLFRCRKTPPHPDPTPLALPLFYCCSLPPAPQSRVFRSSHPAQWALHTLAALDEHNRSSLANEQLRCPQLVVAPSACSLASPAVVSNTGILYIKLAGLPPAFCKAAADGGQSLLQGSNIKFTAREQHKVYCNGATSNKTAEIT
jgi:hypothetical protein